MVETAPQQFPVNPELEKLDRKIVILAKAGYEYEMRASHEDSQSRLHFRKDIGNKLYPHFHFIYNPRSEKTVLHLDERRHVVLHISAEVSHELERLTGVFQILSQSLDKDTAEFAEKTGKFLREASLFNLAEVVNRRNPRKRLRKSTNENKRKKVKKEVRHKVLEKKYKDMSEADEVWYINDWDPIDPELHNEAIRQQEEETDIIESDD